AVKYLASPVANRNDFILSSSPAAERVFISVWDDLSSGVIQDSFCAKLVDQQKVEFAGLPMHYTTGDGPSAAFVRIWTFVSDRGTVYELWTYNGPSGSGFSSENRAGLETFAPQYATGGCP